MLAPIFVSHGAPTLLIEDVPARDFLAGLGVELGRPKAILVVSAHWETDAPTIGAHPSPETIHDFYGFPEELYRLRYAAPGTPAVAGAVKGALEAAGIAATLDPDHGLDHGAWAPLMLAYPNANIPVTQLSIQPARGPSHHYAVGRALAGLKDQDVLIMASGSATHNLRGLAWGRHNAVPAWAEEFDAWLAERIEACEAGALMNYRQLAPGAVQAHPRDEHFLPLFVALGAAGEGARGRRIHASFTHGGLSMAAFRFDR
ncbi:MAG: dioxygenase [Proteobacteria bacterium]|nr:dioxygenase [Pseudomonadota bacterium]